MRKGILLPGLLASLFILSGAGPAQGQTPDFTVNPGHPRIFIHSGNIAELRNRAATTHYDTYATLKQWCDDNWGSLASQRRIFIWGDKMIDAGDMRYALVYALGQIPGHSYSHSIDGYGDQAVSILMDRAGSCPYGRNDIQIMAITYDWIHPRLSSTQRQQVVDCFYTRSGDSPVVGEPEMEARGYRMSGTPYSLYPVLAFYGDGYRQDLADTYLDFIEEGWFEDVKASFHQAGEDGGHVAGPEYAKGYYPVYYHIHQDFYALYTATDATLDDLFGPYSYVTGFPTWILHNIQPGPPSPTSSMDSAVVPLHKWGDMNSMGWNIGIREIALMNTLKLLAHVANEKGETTKARQITWMTDDLLGISRGDSLTYDIIFNDKSITPQSPIALGTDKVKAFGWKESEGRIDYYLDNPKAGVGEVYMRSSWDGLGQSSTDTTYSAFKAFPYFYFGHGHFDSLAFSVFKGESLALPSSGGYFFWYEGNGPDDPIISGFPHHWYYYTRAVSANSLLIMDPNEVTYYRGGGLTHYYRDGGQRPDHEINWWGRVTEDSASDWGGLIKHEDAPDYTYTSGDSTKGYNSIVDGVEHVSQRAPGVSGTPKTTLVQRDYTYLKSSDGDNDYFVVFDRVDSTDPTFKKVFLLHTIGEPIMNGNENLIYGDGNSGLFESDNTDSFTITNPSGQARLFMKTLSPGNTKVYKMGGTVTTTLAQDINDVDGTIVQGPKIDIRVADSSAFPDAPIVVIDGIYNNNPYKETFMCDGKNDATNTLTDCLRGNRYYKGNGPAMHSVGTTVTQYYPWMYRETGTDKWICHPYDFGSAHNEPTENDCDEYGRWGLRIETADDEISTKFLHVLHPTIDMSETSMANTILIEDTLKKMSGVLIDDPLNRKVMMFSNDRYDKTKTSYQIDYSGNAQHIITGLAEGNYNVYYGSGVVYTSGLLGIYQASNQGVLTFNHNGGGWFIIKSDDVPNCIINDLTKYPVPDIPRPDKGQAYIDPVFFTEITRITDASTDMPASGCGQANCDYAQPGYYKHNIENADGTMLIIQSFRFPGWHIWNANPPYNKIKDIPSSILAPSDADCRWDNSNPNVLYCHNGPRFYQWDVQTEQITELHDFTDEFPAATSIGMEEEGDASDDRRYWAFVVREGSSVQQHLVVYDKQTDTVIAQLSRGDGTLTPLGGTEYYLSEGVWISARDTGNPMNYNWVGMSPSGEYVVTGSPPSWIYPRDLSATRVIGTHGHVEVGIDEDGNEVMLDGAANYGTLDPDGRYGWLRMSYLDTGDKYWISPVGIGGAYPSGNSHDMPGWCSYNDYAMEGIENSWATSSMMIIRLSTDHYPSPDIDNYAKLWRVAHTREHDDRYGDKPFGKINKKGTKLFFGSGWGVSWPDGPYDTYQVDLPMECYSYDPPIEEEISCQDGDSKSCDTGLSGVCATGQQTCSGGVWGSCSQTVFSSTEVCTGGADEDCDGDTDCDDSSCDSSIYCMPCAVVTQSCDMVSGPVCCSGGFCDSGGVCQACLSSESGYCSGGLDEDCGGGTDCSDSDCYYETGCCVEEGQTVGSGEHCCSGLSEVQVSGGIPTAIASADVTGGAAPLSVQFTGSGADSDGTIVSYRWSFSNGYSAAYSQNTLRTFREPGIYKVVLTVTDDSGFRGSDEITITVTGASLPGVTASADITSGEAPLTVSFSGDTTDPANLDYYLWDFGFDNFRTVQNTVKTFTEPGNYIVSLLGSHNDYSIKVSETIHIEVTGSNTVCTTGFHRADISPQDGCITMPELSAFINLWFAGSQGVTMPELMQGVTLWKSGSGC